MRSIIVLIFMSLAVRSAAQSVERSVISSGGMSFASTGFAIDYTVGQTAIHTITSGSFIITQGFQQPAVVSNPSSVEPALPNSILVYPNPAVDHFSFSMDNAGNETILVEVFSLHGQKLAESTFSGTGANDMNISELVPGFYPVRITRGSEVFNVVLVKRD